MNRDFQKYKERHLAFWTLINMKRPLIGFTIGIGADVWSYWLYNKSAQKLFSKQNIFPDDINPTEIVEYQPGAEKVAISFEALGVMHRLLNHVNTQFECFLKT